MLSMSEGPETNLLSVNQAFEMLFTHSRIILAFIFASTEETIPPIVTLKTNALLGNFNDHPLTPRTDAHWRR